MTGATRWAGCRDACARHRWTLGYLAVMSTLTFLAVVLHWRI